MTTNVAHERMLTIKEVMHRTSFSKPHIYRQIKFGLFPRQVSVGENRVAWVESEIDTYIADAIDQRDVS